MKRLTLAASIYIVTAAASTYAHHSHPLTYDWCKSVTVEGRVESVEYKEPHSIIVVRQDDGATYIVDWMPLGGLTRNGILESAKGALVSGARVSVTGAPIRSAAEIRASFPDFKADVNPRMIDPWLIRRVGDTFSWSVSQPLPDPAKCAGVFKTPPSRVP